MTKGGRKKKEKREARAKAEAAQSSTPPPLRVQPTPLKVKAPSVDQELLIPKSFDIPYSVTCTQEHDAYYNCEIGCASYDGQPVTLVKCDTYREVKRCFERSHVYGKTAFSPITSYKHGSNYLVLGRYVGDKFEDWLRKDHNYEKLWTNPKATKKPPNQKDKKDHLGNFTDLMVKVGRQLFESATIQHQNDRFIGNIREGMCINSNGDVSFLPPRGKIGRIEDGIRKDLMDLRWFLDVVYKRFEETHNKPLGYWLFYSVYPLFLETVKDVAQLKALSYKLCHFPFFWGTRERYLFSEVLHKVYGEAKRAGGSLYFEKMVPLHDGLSNVGEWWNDIMKLSVTNVLRKIYAKGSKQDPNYTHKFGIAGFLRNSLQHYKEHDSTKTLVDVDQQLLRAFPDVYMKIYKAMASPAPGTNMFLDQRLQEGVSPLNYNK